MHTGLSILTMELSNRKKRERPQTKFIDVVKEDMQWVGVTAENGRDGLKWVADVLHRGVCLSSLQRTSCNTIIFPSLPHVAQNFPFYFPHLICIHKQIPAICPLQQSEICSSPLYFSYLSSACTPDISSENPQIISFIPPLKFIFYSNRLPTVYFLLFELLFSKVASADV